MTGLNIGVHRLNIGVRLPGSCAYWVVYCRSPMEVVGKLAVMFKQAWEKVKWNGMKQLLFPAQIKRLTIPLT